MNTIENEPYVDFEELAKVVAKVDPRDLYQIGDKLPLNSPYLPEVIQCPAPFSHYAASSSGKIIGRTRHILATATNNAGYEMVEVQKDNGKYTTTTVHHLVALAWVKKPETNEKLIVDHINDDKLDNRASNLRWVTYHINLVKYHRMETMSGNNSYSHGRAVVKIYEDGKEKFYKSLSSASRDNDLSVTSIQGSANGTLHLNKPYHFIFAK